MTAKDTLSQLASMLLSGNVEVVESFPDLKVRVVTAFPDLDVQVAPVGRPRVGGTCDELPAAYATLGRRDEARQAFEASLAGGVYELVMRFDYGSVIPWVRRIEGGLLAIAGVRWFRRLPLPHLLEARPGRTGGPQGQADRGQGALPEEGRPHLAQQAHGLGEAFVAVRHVGDDGDAFDQQRRQAEPPCGFGQVPGHAVAVAGLMPAV